MDKFEAMRIHYDFDKYLKVTIVGDSAINAESTIYTEKFLNDRVMQLDLDDKWQLLDLVEGAIVSNKFDIKNDNDYVIKHRDTQDYDKTHKISVIAWANIEREEKIKFIRIWLHNKRLELLEIENEEYKDNNILIDLGNEKISSKIVYLSELGILDHLIKVEPFNTSINLLANALSGITGDKAETIQSYLNPIFSKDAGQKNNPLNRPNSLNKVRQSLINIGFNPHN